MNKEKTHNPNRFLRTLAFITLITFVSTDTLFFHSQSLALTVPATFLVGQNTRDLSASAQAWKDRVPTEFGTIEDVYIAQKTEHQESTDYGVRSAENGERGDEHLLRTPYSVPRTIVYIQDAHDSLEAQQNIAKIITHLVRNFGVRTVFEEGYEGPVPTDEFFGFIKDPLLKEKTAAFFMDHLRIGAAEYAHINRMGSGAFFEKQKKEPDSNTDWVLLGADSLALQKKGIQSYRGSEENRRAVEKDLAAFEAELKPLIFKRLPNEFKQWLKEKESFSKGEISPVDYLARSVGYADAGTLAPLAQIRRLLEVMSRPQDLDRDLSFSRKRESVSGSPIKASGDDKIRRFEDDRQKERLNQINPSELFREMEALDNGITDAWLKTEDEQRIFRFYQNVQLLKKLAKVKVSDAEFDALKERLADFTTRRIGELISRAAGKPLVLSKRWETQIRSALDFYEISRQRDGAISKVLDRYLISQRPDVGEQMGSDPLSYSKGTGTILEKQKWSQSPPPSVLVYGGFHKENIKRILKEKGFNYVIVSPKITAPSPRHEAFYKRLMTIGHHDFEASVALRTGMRAQGVLSMGRIGRAEIRAVYDALASGVAPEDVALELEKPVRPEARPDAVNGPREAKIRSEARQMTRQDLKPLLEMENRVIDEIFLALPRDDGFQAEVKTVYDRALRSGETKKVDDPAYSARRIVARLIFELCKEATNRWPPATHYVEDLILPSSSFPEILSAFRKHPTSPILNLLATRDILQNIIEFGGQSYIGPYTRSYDPLPKGFFSAYGNKAGTPAQMVEQVFASRGWYVEAPLPMPEYGEKSYKLFLVPPLPEEMAPAVKAILSAGYTVDGQPFPKGLQTLMARVAQHGRALVKLSEENFNIDVAISPGMTSPHPTLQEIAMLGQDRLNRVGLSKNLLQQIRDRLVAQGIKVTPLEISTENGREIMRMTIPAVSQSASIDNGQGSMPAVIGPSVKLSSIPPSFFSLPEVARMSPQINTIRLLRNGKPIEPGPLQPEDELHVVYDGISDNEGKGETWSFYAWLSPRSMRITQWIETSSGQSRFNTLTFKREDSDKVIGQWVAEIPGSPKEPVNLSDAGPLPEPLKSLRNTFQTILIDARGIAKSNERTPNGPRQKMAEDASRFLEEVSRSEMRQEPNGQAREEESAGQKRMKLAEEKDFLKGEVFIPVQKDENAVYLLDYRFDWLLSLFQRVCNLYLTYDEKALREYILANKEPVGGMFSQVFAGWLKSVANVREFAFHLHRYGEALKKPEFIDFFFWTAETLEGIPGRAFILSNKEKIRLLFSEVLREDGLYFYADEILPQIAAEPESVRMILAHELAHRYLKEAGKRGMLVSKIFFQQHLVKDPDFRELLQGWFPSYSETIATEDGWNEFVTQILFPSPQEMGLRMNDAGEVYSTYKESDGLPYRADQTYLELRNLLISTDPALGFIESYVSLQTMLLMHDLQKTIERRDLNIRSEARWQDPPQAAVLARDRVVAVRDRVLSGTGEEYLPYLDLRVCVELTQKILAEGNDAVTDQWLEMKWRRWLNPVTGWKRAMTKNFGRSHVPTRRDHLITGLSTLGVMVIAMLIFAAGVTMKNGALAIASAVVAVLGFIGANIYPFAKWKIPNLLFYAADHTFLRHEDALMYLALYPEMMLGNVHVPYGPAGGRGIDLFSMKDGNYQNESIPAQYLHAAGSLIYELAESTLENAEQAGLLDTEFVSYYLYTNFDFFYKTYILPAAKKSEADDPGIRIHALSDMFGLVANAHASIGQLMRLFPVHRRLFEHLPVDRMEWSMDGVGQAFSDRVFKKVRETGLRDAGGLMHAPMTLLTGAGLEAGEILHIMRVIRKTSEAYTPGADAEAGFESPVMDSVKPVLEANERFLDDPTREHLQEVKQAAAGLLEKLGGNVSLENVEKERGEIRGFEGGFSRRLVAGGTAYELAVRDSAGQRDDIRSESEKLEFRRVLIENSMDEASRLDQAVASFDADWVTRVLAQVFDLNEEILKYSKRQQRSKFEIDLRDRSGKPVPPFEAARGNESAPYDLKNDRLYRLLLAQFERLELVKDASTGAKIIPRLLNLRFEDEHGNVLKEIPVFDGVLNGIFLVITGIHSPGGKTVAKITFERGARSEARPIAQQPVLDGLRSLHSHERSELSSAMPYWEETSGEPRRLVSQDEKSQAVLEKLVQLREHGSLVAGEQAELDRLFDQIHKEYLSYRNIYLAAIRGELSRWFAVKPGDAALSRYNGRVAGILEEIDKILPPAEKDDVFRPFGPGETAPKISIGIIFSNKGEAGGRRLQNLKDLLRSLQTLKYDHDKLQVVLLDNGSEDELMAEALKKEFPWVRMFRNDQNLYAAGGRNLVMRLAQQSFDPDYFFLLDDDTFLPDPETLTRLVRINEDPGGKKSPRIAFSGPDPVMPLPDGSWGWQEIASWKKWARLKPEDPRCHGTIAVIGAAQFFPKWVLEEVGFMDPRFGVYHEEWAWHMKAGLKGFANVNIDQRYCRIVHNRIGGGGYTPFGAYFMARNMFLIDQQPDLRWAGAPWHQRALPRAVILILKTAQGKIPTPSWKTRAQVIVSMIHGIVDGLLRRWTVVAEPHVREIVLPSEPEKTGEDSAVRSGQREPVPGDEDENAKSEMRVGNLRVFDTLLSKAFGIQKNVERFSPDYVSDRLTEMLGCFKAGDFSRVRLMAHRFLLDFLECLADSKAEDPGLEKILTDLRAKDPEGELSYAFRDLPRRLSRMLIDQKRLFESQKWSMIPLWYVMTLHEAAVVLAPSAQGKPVDLKAAYGMIYKNNPFPAVEMKTLSSQLWVVLRALSSLKQLPDCVMPFFQKAVLNGLMWLYWFFVLLLLPVRMVMGLYYRHWFTRWSGSSAIFVEELVRHFYERSGHPDLRTSLASLFGPDQGSEPRRGLSWEAKEHFLATSLDAVYHGFPPLRMATRKEAEECVKQSPGTSNGLFHRGFSPDAFSVFERAEKVPGINLMMFLEPEWIHPVWEHGEKKIRIRTALMSCHGSPVIVDFRALGMEEPEIHYSFYPLSVKKIPVSGHPMVAAYTGEKDVASVLLERGGVRIPRWRALIVEDEISRRISRIRRSSNHVLSFPKAQDLGERVKDQLIDFIESKEGYQGVPDIVVKPNDGLQGRDVVLAHYNDISTLIAAFHKMLELTFHGTSVIMQERIIPPFLDQHQTPQDYNFRVFVSPNSHGHPEVSRIVVRYDREGEAVNLSRTAKPLTMDELFDRMDLPALERIAVAADIKDQAVKAYEAIRQGMIAAGEMKAGDVMSDFFGVDILIREEDGKLLAYVIEVNDYHSGGMWDLDQRLRELGREEEVGESNLLWIEQMKKRGEVYRAGVEERAVRFGRLDPFRRVARSVPAMLEQSLFELRRGMKRFELRGNADEFVQRSVAEINPEHGDDQAETRGGERPGTPEGLEQPTAQSRINIPEWVRSHKFLLNTFVVMGVLFGLVMQVPEKFPFSDVPWFLGFGNLRVMAGFVTFFTFGAIVTQLRELVKKSDFRPDREHLMNGLNWKRIGIHFVLALAVFQWFWPLTYYLWTHAQIPHFLFGFADQLFTLPLTLALLYPALALVDRDAPAETLPKVRQTVFWLAALWIPVFAAVFGLLPLDPETHEPSAIQNLLIAMVEPFSALMITYIAGKSGQEVASLKVRHPAIVPALIGILTFNLLVCVVYPLVFPPTLVSPVIVSALLAASVFYFLVFWHGFVPVPGQPPDSSSFEARREESGPADLRKRPGHEPGEPGPGKGEGPRSEMRVVVSGPNGPIDWEKMGWPVSSKLAQLIAENQTPENGKISAIVNALDDIELLTMKRFCAYLDALEVLISSHSFFPGKQFLETQIKQIHGKRLGLAFIEHFDRGGVDENPFESEWYEFVRLLILSHALQTRQRESKDAGLQAINEKMQGFIRYFIWHWTESADTYGINADQQVEERLLGLIGSQTDLGEIAGTVLRKKKEWLEVDPDPADMAALKRFADEFLQIRQTPFVPEMEQLHRELDLVLKGGNVSPHPWQDPLDYLASISGQAPAVVLHPVSLIDRPDGENAKLPNAWKFQLAWIERMAKEGFRDWVFVTTYTKYVTPLADQFKKRERPTPVQISELLVAYLNSNAPSLVEFLNLPVARARAPEAARAIEFWQKVRDLRKRFGATVLVANETDSGRYEKHMKQFAGSKRLLIRPEHLVDFGKIGGLPYKFALEAEEGVVIIEQHQELSALHNIGDLEAKDALLHSAHRVGEQIGWGKLRSSAVPVRGNDALRAVLMKYKHLIPEVDRFFYDDLAKRIGEGRVECANAWVVTTDSDDDGDHPGSVLETDAPTKSKRLKPVAPRSETRGGGASATGAGDYGDDYARALDLLQQGRIDELVAWQMRDERGRIVNGNPNDWMRFNNQGRKIHSPAQMFFGHLHDEKVQKLRETLADFYLALPDSPLRRWIVSSMIWQISEPQGPHDEAARPFAIDLMRRIIERADARFLAEQEQIPPRQFNLRNTVLNDIVFQLVVIYKEERLGDQALSMLEWMTANVKALAPLAVRLPAGLAVVEAGKARVLFDLIEGLVRKEDGVIPAVIGTLVAHGFLDRFGEGRDYRRERFQSLILNLPEVQWELAFNALRGIFLTADSSAFKTIHEIGNLLTAFADRDISENGSGETVFEDKGNTRKIAGFAYSLILSPPDFIKKNPRIDLAEIYHRGEDLLFQLALGHEGQFEIVKEYLEKRVRNAPEASSRFATLLEEIEQARAQRPEGDAGVPRDARAETRKRDFSGADNHSSDSLIRNGSFYPMSASTRFLMKYRGFSRAMEGSSAAVKMGSFVLSASVFGLVQWLVFHQPQAAVFPYALLLTMVFHEFSHAVGAVMAGDDGARKFMTLKPWRHFTIPGFIFLPLFGMTFGRVFINMEKMDRKQKLLAISAGPVGNLGLGLLLVGIAYLFGDPMAPKTVWASAFGMMGIVNLVFGFECQLIPMSIFGLKTDGEQIRSLLFGKPQPVVAPETGGVQTPFNLKRRLRELCDELSRKEFWPLIRGRAEEMLRGISDQLTVSDAGREEMTSQYADLDRRFAGLGPWKFLRDIGPYVEDADLLAFMVDHPQARATLLLLKIYSEKTLDERKPAGDPRSETRGSRSGGSDEAKEEAVSREAYQRLVRATAIFRLIADPGTQRSSGLDLLKKMRWEAAQLLAKAEEMAATVSDPVLSKTLRSATGTVLGFNGQIQAYFAMLNLEPIPGEEMAAGEPLSVLQISRFVSDKAMGLLPAAEFNFIEDEAMRKCLPALPEWDSPDLFDAHEKLAPIHLSEFLKSLKKKRPDVYQKIGALLKARGISLTDFVPLEQLNPEKFRIPFFEDAVRQHLLRSETREYTRRSFLHAATTVAAGLFTGARAFSVAPDAKKPEIVAPEPASGDLPDKEDYDLEKLKALFANEGPFDAYMKLSLFPSSADEYPDQLKEAGVRLIESAKTVSKDPGRIKRLAELAALTVELFERCRKLSSSEIDEKDDGLIGKAYSEWNEFAKMAGFFLGPSFGTQKENGYVRMGLLRNKIIGSVEVSKEPDRPGSDPGAIKKDTIFMVRAADKLGMLLAEESAFYSTVLKSIALQTDKQWELYRIFMSGSAVSRFAEKNFGLNKTVPVRHLVLLKPKLTALLEQCGHMLSPDDRKTVEALRDAIPSPSRGAGVLAAFFHTRKEEALNLEAAAGHLQKTDGLTPEAASQKLAELLASVSKIHQELRDRINRVPAEWAPLLEADMNEQGLSRERLEKLPLLPDSDSDTYDMLAEMPDADRELYQKVFNLLAFNAIPHEALHAEEWESGYDLYRNPALTEGRAYAVGAEQGTFFPRLSILELLYVAMFAPEVAGTAHHRAVRILVRYVLCKLLKKPDDFFYEASGGKVPEDHRPLTPEEALVIVRKLREPGGLVEVRKAFANFLSDKRIHDDNAVLPENRQKIWIRTPGGTWRAIIVYAGKALREAVEKSGLAALFPVRPAGLSFKEQSASPSTLLAMNAPPPAAISGVVTGLGQINDLRSETRATQGDVSGQKRAAADGIRTVARKKAIAAEEKDVRAELHIAEPKPAAARDIRVPTTDRRSWMDAALPRNFYFVIDGETLGKIGVGDRLWVELLAIKGIYGKDLRVHVAGATLSEKAAARVRELQSFGGNVLTGEDVRMPGNAKAVYFTNDERTFADRQRVLRELRPGDFLCAIQFVVADLLKEAIPEGLGFRRFLDERLDRLHFDVGREVARLFATFEVITRAA